MVAVSRAGFVLVGGKSSRMGRDKALLRFGARTLAEHVAAAVEAAAGSVTLIGDPSKYSYLGYPVIGDEVPNCGPLAGILTALEASAADWNLLVACDLPQIAAAFLRTLLVRAERSGTDCLLPAGSSGLPEPLCAVYHRRCAAAIRQAIASGIRKVTAGLAGLEVEIWRTPESTVFHNLNTEDDWHTYLAGSRDTSKTRSEGE